MATESEVGELLHQRGWRTAFTVTEKVNAWAALVSVIERGYGTTSASTPTTSTAETGCTRRGSCWTNTSSNSGTPRIKALDDQYKAVTIDDDGQALDQFHRLPGPDLWWWRRHPRILTGDLGRSLRSAGAIGADPDTA
ncbi:MULTISPECIES: hypothetical protein [unclassified Streptomyces]|uniref:hypothetical protein n=1 Tax=unclassified Streptomyces TaxID=2593676 RepID=UPI001F2A051C|nr:MULTISPECIES: hypothetical protein [unclassified Streptomyces]